MAHALLRTVSALMPTHVFNRDTRSPTAEYYDCAVLVSPGVHLFELPLPFSLGTVNVYLVRLTHGFLLIDCGMNTDACFAALDSARQSLGVEWREIHEILLTHIHPDHMGLAPRLLALTGASLSMHPSDALLLARITSSDDRRRTDEQLAGAGSPPETIAETHWAFAEIGKNFQELQPRTLLSGGETIAIEGGTLEVIWTPGHSPGHLCLYDAQRRLLFSGDHILEHISPKVGWQPEDDPLGAYLQSLRNIEALDIDLILPSHGFPFRGHREWIAGALAHHRERCDRILEFLNEGAKTSHELVCKLWTRPLSPFHYRFAVYEVLAHLEYLRRLEQVTPNRAKITQWALAEPAVARR